MNEVCEQLRPLRFNDPVNGENIEREEPLAMGTTLFELYLALQRLYL